jgi:hypothetical protein
MNKLLRGRLIELLGRNLEGGFGHCGISGFHSLASLSNNGSQGCLGSAVPQASLFVLSRRFRSISVIRHGFPLNANDTMTAPRGRATACQFSRRTLRLPAFLRIVATERPQQLRRAGLR